MANQYGQLNLLRLFGAYATVDANGKNVVVIPCDLNDIQLYTSQTTGKIVSADLRINTNELSDDARMKNAANHQKIDNYIPPTHFVKLAISKHIFNNRYPSAAAKQIQQHPEWAGYASYDAKLPDGTINPLYSAVSNLLRPIIGELRNSGGAPQQLQGAAPQSQSAPQGGFSAPTQEDDLPF